MTLRVFLTLGLRLVEVKPKLMSALLVRAMTVRHPSDRYSSCGYERRT